ncbi:MAG TPA: molybdate ABC transporter substrate-binding protein [Symbiobacteriaceae bacterium]|nr:molybdate ABC transporter substrate-binding protein [Symbiobacteriaceae bacterium]
MRRLLSGALAGALLLMAAGCGGTPRQAEVVVSAAASLTDALKEAQQGFEQEHGAVKLRLNFGSSGALQQQAEQGAPVDLFVSAATAPMEVLVSKGLVEPSAVRTLATNKVVLIRSKAGEAVVKNWDDLRSDQVKKVAIGNPQHVPAGQYGKAVLEHLNLWGAVEPRLVLGEDVRQVLAYVETGEVQAGLVYSTDAALSQKVVVVAEAPAGSHAPIVYPVAVLKESKHPAEARSFADYLASDHGQAILKKYGFEVGGK